MDKKVEAFKAVMIVLWCLEGICLVSGFFSEKLLSLTGLSLPLSLVPIVFTVIYFKTKKNSKNNASDKMKNTYKQDKAINGISASQSKSNETPAICKTESNNINENEFDSLMTVQLIAYYKKEFDKKYMNEYIRRLVHIGFDENEAFNLFTNESMNMKHESIDLLQSPTYITDFYFNLKNKILPLDNKYYIEHRMFSVSEITKIWDEAEWHYHYSHGEDIPDDVWNEIYMLTRYGSGELFVETLKSIANSSHIDIDKIQKFSMNEQNMLFKYKWNKSGNEKHPYH